MLKNIKVLKILYWKYYAKIMMEDVSLKGISYTK